MDCIIEKSAIDVGNQYLLRHCRHSPIRLGGDDDHGLFAGQAEDHFLSNRKRQVWCLVSRFTDPNSFDIHIQLALPNLLENSSPVETIDLKRWHAYCCILNNNLTKEQRGIQMSIFDRQELKKLSENQDAPCISLYIPPTGPESPQRFIRLKNALSTAEKKLSLIGVGNETARKVLAPLRDLVEQPLGWHDRNGLAVFISQSSFHVYRIPLQVPELVLVGERFYLRPLMPLLSGDGRFIILALSQKSVRLYEANQFDIRELDKHDVPKSLVDAVGYDLRNRSLQFHTGSPKHGKRLKREALYHGQGAGKDDIDGEVTKFLQLVDRGIRKLLSGTNAPLAIAAVEYLCAAFKQVSKYPNILDGGIFGNPQLISLEELHQRAWEMVSPYFRKDQETAAARFHDALSTSLASHALKQIVPAAYNARVDTLFVSKEHQVWGKYDRENELLEVREGNAQPDDEGLLDVAATQCLLNGGTVYAVAPQEMPIPGPIAAIFRYQRT